MALEFASKMRHVQKDPNIGTNGVDLLTNPGGAGLANSDFINTESIRFKGNEAGAVYVGVGGTVTVIPSKRNAGSYYAMEFKNVPNGSFLPVAGKDLLYTSIPHLALNQELISIINTTSLSTPANQLIIATKNFTAKHFRGADELNTVKISMGWNAGTIVAARIISVSGSFFNNLDFVQANDTIVIESEITGEPADFVFTITSGIIKTVSETTATGIIAYR